MKNEKEFEAKVEQLELQLDEARRDAVAQAGTIFTLTKERNDAHRLLDEARRAVKIGATWMRWWLQNQECDCEAGHICGRQDRLIELEQMDSILREPEKRVEPQQKCTCVWMDCGHLGVNRDPLVPCAVHDKKKV